MIYATYKLPQRPKGLEKTILFGGYDMPSLAYQWRKDWCPFEPPTDSASKATFDQAVRGSVALQRQGAGVGFGS